jgi:hypothetical protein
LAALRGEMTLLQIHQLDKHDEMLADYQHLLAVALNPARFVDTTGLDAEAAAEKLVQVSKQAARMVLPTERDTMSGAIQALSKALLASFAARRTVAGMTLRQMNGRRPQGAEDEPEVLRDMSTLDVPSLRSVRLAMDLLRGDFQQHNEPPMPPPPEGLDDLVVTRDETPSDA